MKALRRATVATLAVLSLLTSPTQAVKFGTDHSDLWYIVAESGWGMQLVQRGTVIFATLFVYGPNGAPTWYVATLPFIGNNAWTGDLYATTGPWFGTVPFNPANVTRTIVGTMTWTPQTTDTGNVFYTVNGVAVNKNVVRQTLVFDDFSGHYLAGIHTDNTGCLSFLPTSEAAGLLYVVQNGQAITMQFVKGTDSCSFPGTLSQNGQMGSVQGSFVCSDGSAGTFSLFEMQVTESGTTSRFALNYSNPPGCQGTGWFGGMRATTF